MDSLKVTLFGQPSLYRGQERLEIKSRKGWALLAYLTLVPNPIPRERLATLLWPEQDAAGGRRNLRRLLYTLNQSPLQAYLVADPEAISFNQAVEIDVHHFLSRLAAEDWAGAVSLYNGDLIDGVLIGDSNLFETWVSDQREQLRQQMLQALTALAEQQVAENDLLQAEATIRRQLSLDSWNEQIWRRLFTLLAESGRRAQVLSEYHHCQQLLKSELGVLPSSETVSLFEAIRDGQFQSGPVQGGHYAVPPPQALPHQEARKVLLEKVEQAWIKTLLVNSLGPRPLIDIHKASQPTALAYPWTSLIDRPMAKRASPYPSQAIIDIFEAEGRSLLILGEPGAGKTTTLLTLAEQLLKRAQSDPAHPLPVVLPLSTWHGEPLEAWIKSEINTTYRIPQPILSDWVRNQQLIVLCDGLDELPVEQQSDCILSINRFRETYGLTPLVVCSRLADYETQTVSLNVNGAISLQPLSQAQINAFLQDDFPQLKRRLSKDQSLRQLTQSPLLLSLVISLFGNLAQREFDAVVTEPLTLFRSYLQQQLNQDPQSKRISPQRLRLFLGWLAKEMAQRNEAIFFLDRIQPDRLSRRRAQLFYFFLSRFMGAFMLEIAWSYRDLGWGSITAGIYLGSIVAGAELLIQIIGHRWRWSHLQSDQTHRLIRSAVIGLLVSSALIPFGWIALVNGLIFGLFFGWRPPSHTPAQDIRMVEQLAWRWQTFFIGGGIGLCLGGLVFAYNVSDLYAAGTGLLSIVVLFTTFGGLQGESIPTQIRPNEGVWLSWRNGLLGGSVVGGAMFVAAFGIEAARGESLIVPFLVGLQYVVMAGLWYGGLDLINHFVLRLMLRGTDQVPINILSYLEEGSRRRLLYRAGGGYQFLHAELRKALLGQTDESSIS